MKNHKQWVGEVFDNNASDYGKKSNSFFDYFGKRLVEQVDILPGQHILDVATGRGASLFPASKAVGSLGKVVGIDISQQMIKETSKEVQEKNIPWIELQCIDAEHLNFSDNCFDVVLCGFALFFFPSISAALSEFKRVLKPGGILAVSTWGKDSKIEILMNKELENYQTNSLITNPLWSEKELRKVLHLADFDNIRVVEETKIFFHETADAWWNSLWGHATRAKFEQLLPKQIADLREKILKKVSVLNTGQGIAEDLNVFYGIAYKI